MNPVFHGNFHQPEWDSGHPEHPEMPGSMRMCKNLCPGTYYLN